MRKLTFLGEPPRFARRRAVRSSPSHALRASARPLPSLSRARPLGAPLGGKKLPNYHYLIF